MSLTSNDPTQKHMHFNSMKPFFQNSLQLADGALLLIRFVAFVKELAFPCEEWLCGK